MRILIEDIMDNEDMAEFFNERAAIIEFDGGLSKEDAELEAIKQTEEKFGIKVI